MRAITTATIAATVLLASAFARAEPPAPTDSPAPIASPVESPAAIATPAESPAPIASPADSPAPIASPVESPGSAAPAESPAAIATPAESPAPIAAPTEQALPMHADPYAGIMRVRLSTHPIIVGVKAGPAFPGGAFAMGAGAALEFRQPFALEGRVGGWIEVGYLSTSAKGQVSSAGLPAPTPFRVSVTEIPLVAGAFYRQPLPAGIFGYGGAGIAVAPTSTVSRAGGGSVTETGIARGFDLSLGAERAFGSGLIVLEGGYRLLSSTSRATGPGNLFGPGVRVGYRRAF